MVPDNMVPVVDKSHVCFIRERSGLCGNSIVRECIKYSFKLLVHGTPLPIMNRDFGAIILDETITPRYVKKRWGTPYASNSLYAPYKKLTPRSTTVFLFNQVWYHDKNTLFLDNWRIDPRFVEWMMGFWARGER